MLNGSHLQLGSLPAIHLSAATMQQLVVGLSTVLPDSKQICSFEAMKELLASHSAWGAFGLEAFDVGQLLECLGLGLQRSITARTVELALVSSTGAFAVEGEADLILPTWAPQERQWKRQQRQQQSKQQGKAVAGAQKQLQQQVPGLRDLVGRTGGTLKQQCKRALQRCPSSPCLGKRVHSGKQQQIYMQQLPLPSSSLRPIDLAGIVGKAAQTKSGRQQGDGNISSKSSPSTPRKRQTPLSHMTESLKKSTRTQPLRGLQAHTCHTSQPESSCPGSATSQGVGVRAPSHLSARCARQLGLTQQYPSIMQPL